MRARVTIVEGGRRRERDDQLAAEEPLEIRLQAAGETQTVAVTMRTPGSDFELAAGFLHNEGIISEPSMVNGITYCVDADVDADQRYNIVTSVCALQACRSWRPLNAIFIRQARAACAARPVLTRLRCATARPCRQDRRSARRY